MIEQAVIDFLEALEPAQRARALVPLDSPNRHDWHYVPRDRRGATLRDLNPTQRSAAMAILRAALSERGYARCTDIMRLDAIVAEIEHDPVTYDPTNYAVTVFGTPGGDAVWGWRVEGHHLSLNFLHARDAVRVTPTFFGANPASVEHGPLTGLRVLGDEEDLGRRLVRGLDETGRRTALIAPRAFDDILTGPGREASLRQPVGIAYAALDAAGRSLAEAIIEQFIGAMRPEIAAPERARLHAAGLDAVRFAWAGSLEPRQPHYYRLHGPALLIEYDNTQDDANH
ncbi:MAG: DUF3500 domain-containing protein, partial [Alphaproteobacteria bacterium]|nr:DUF3500 domain-containing protein [Alphaproteobacteria bacterium]